MMQVVFKRSLSLSLLFLSGNGLLLCCQMVKLCWAHGLYDAIFYVYNRGMRDYSTPLEVTGLYRVSYVI